MLHWNPRHLTLSPSPPMPWPPHATLRPQMTLRPHTTRAATVARLDLSGSAVATTLGLGPMWELSPAPLSPSCLPTWTMLQRRRRRCARQSMRSPPFGDASDLFALVRSWLDMHRPVHWVATWALLLRNYHPIQCLHSRHLRLARRLRTWATRTALQKTTRSAVHSRTLNSHTICFSRECLSIFTGSISAGND